MSSYQRLSESGLGASGSSAWVNNSQQMANEVPEPPSSTASGSVNLPEASGGGRGSERGDDQVLAVGGLYNRGYAISYPTLEPLPPEQQLTSGSANTNGAITHTRVPVLVSDDILSGSLTGAGRMSPVRRFFCLLVTFDVLFTGLLWVITVVVTGRDLEKAMRQQVLEYRITSSMFDTVMAATLRFAAVIICYAIFGVRHWWPIALTTAGSSVFLIAKVFKYQWVPNDYLTFDVTLVLLSFILAWGELWFFDFRVLPLETKAKELCLMRQRQLNSGERAPLLNMTRSAMMERYMESAETVSVTGSNFYSIAAHTPAASDDEDDQHSETDFSTRVRSCQYMKNRYKPMSKDVLDKAWTTMTKSTDWKFHSESKGTGDKLETKMFNNRKIFRLTTTLDIPARLLLEELFYKAEGSPKWNDLVTEIKVVQTLDSNTDVLYQVCANGLGGGVVSTRDFVYLRHWQLIDGVYVMSMASINHATVPPNPSFVRCEAGPCAFALRQSSTVPNKCTFQWLFNNDLKLSLPRFVIDKAVISSQSDFMNNLRRRIEILKVELNI